MVELNRAVAVAQAGSPQAALHIVEGLELDQYRRVAQRLLALTAGVWHNWLIDAADKRSLVAYDH